MGKSQRNQARGARQKIAEQRAAERRAGRVRTALLAGSSVLVVLVVVVVLVAVKLGGSPAPVGGARADIAVARQIGSVPAAVFDAVGKGTASGLAPVAGRPELTSGGKPEVLYMGGEYCPFCAAERWALAAALSRFGTFSGLRFIHSSPTDVYPGTPTLSFYGSRYASRYLAFSGVEWYGERNDPSTPFGHVYLQRPTGAELAAFSRFARGSVPFVDIGDRYLVPQAQYLPSALAGLTWAQVAAAMRNPASPVARDVDGAANMITAAICTLTHGRPGDVCSSSGVTAARGSI